MKAKKRRERGFWKKMPARGVIASEAKQPIGPHKERMDCFASLAMTEVGTRPARAVAWLVCQSNAAGCKTQPHDDVHPQYRFGLLPEPLTAPPTGGWKTFADGDPAGSIHQT